MEQNGDSMLMLNVARKVHLTCTQCCASFARETFKNSVTFEKQILDSSTRGNNTNPCSLIEKMKKACTKRSRDVDEIQPGFAKMTGVNKTTEISRSHLLADSILAVGHSL